MKPLASIDDWLEEAGALDKALLPLGFLLAFCAQHRLLSGDFTQLYPQQLSSLRLQEGRVTTLLAAHGGTLYENDFNPQGQIFLRRYLPYLKGNFAETFGADCYEIADDWANYQLFAAVLVRHFLGHPSRPTVAANLWLSLKNRVVGLWR